MMTATREVAVLADQQGNLYVIPRRVVERGRLPEAQKQTVLQQLRAWTPPTDIRPVRILGWTSVEEAGDTSPA